MALQELNVEEYFLGKIGDPNAKPKILSLKLDPDAGRKIKNGEIGTEPRWPIYILMPVQQYFAGDNRSMSCVVVLLYS